MGKYRAMYNQLKRQAWAETTKQAALPNALLRLLGQAPKKPSIWKKLLPLLGLGAAGGAVAAIPEAREFAGGALNTGKDTLEGLLAQIRGGNREHGPIGNHGPNIGGRLDLASRQLECAGLGQALARSIGSRDPQAIGIAQSDLASFIGNTPAESTAVRPNNAELRSTYTNLSRQLKGLLGTPEGDEILNLMRTMREGGINTLSNKPGPGLTEGPKGDIMNFLRQILGA
jgi:hypothetical protein